MKLSEPQKRILRTMLRGKPDEIWNWRASGWNGNTVNGLLRKGLVAGGTGIVLTEAGRTAAEEIDG